MLQHLTTHFPDKVQAGILQEMHPLFTRFTELEISQYILHLSSQWIYSNVDNNACICCLYAEDNKSLYTPRRQV